jgi:MtaA/CmuA family methyltransferase
MTSRERIRATIAGRPIDRLAAMPITMMFAADLIGRTYREYVTDHRVLAEAQLRTAEAFDLDYVSVISDPAREAADCGAHVRFFDDQPPAIEEDDPLLADKAALLRLRVPDPERAPRMSDRLRGVALLREQSGDRMVEGWIEGPCAEGADLRGLGNLMLDFIDDGAFIRDLFAFVVAMETRFALAQIARGAELVGIGDAAASLVGPDIYQEFVLPCERQLVDRIHAAGAMVRLHICGNTRPLLPYMGGLGCEIVDLDTPSPVDEARRAMGPEQVLLGNVHTVHVLRNGTPVQVRDAVAECHRQAGPRYIIGAGCEVPRGTPHENLRALVEYGRATAAGA